MKFFSNNIEWQEAVKSLKVSKNAPKSGAGCGKVFFFLPRDSSALCTRLILAAENEKLVSDNSIFADIRK